MYRYRHLRTGSLIAALLAAFGVPSLSSAAGPKSEPEQHKPAASQSEQTAEKTAPQDLIKKELKSEDGDKLGSIEQVVVQKGTEQTHAVVSVSQFLGLSSKEVAVPVNHLRLGDEGVILMSQGMPTEQFLEALPEYDPAQYEAYEPKAKPKPRQ